MIIEAMADGKRILLNSKYIYEIYDIDTDTPKVWTAITSTEYLITHETCMAIIGEHNSNVKIVRELKGIKDVIKGKRWQ